MPNPTLVDPDLSIPTNSALTAEQKAELLHEYEVANQMIGELHKKVDDAERELQAAEDRRDRAISAANHGRPLNTSPGVTPWKIRDFRRRTTAVQIIDANGETIVPFASPEIAGRIVAAINMVECAHPIERGQRVDEQS